MNMVEKVARAICSSNDYDPDAKGSFDEPRWYDYRHQARAAIKAMGEISGRPEYMVDMWFGAKPHDGFGKAKWQEVINAALDEPS